MLSSFYNTFYRNNGVKQWLLRLAYAAIAYILLSVAVFLLTSQQRQLLRKVTEDQVSTTSRKGRADSGNSRHLRVISLNLWLTQTAGTGDLKAERLQTFLDFVASGSYDVVIVQELPVFALGPIRSSARAQQASSFLSKAGFKYRTSLIDGVPYLRLFGQNSGNAVFSRYPITYAKNGGFSSWSLREVLNKKGFVIADLSVGGCTVRVASLHTDASPDKSVRLSQLRQVLDELSKLSPQPLILAGDFNTCSLDTFDCSEYNSFLKILDNFQLKEAFPGQKGTWRSYPMDHVVISKLQDLSLTNASLRMIRSPGGLAASDHLAMDFNVSFKCHWIKAFSSISHQTWNFRASLPLHNCLRSPHWAAIFYFFFFQLIPSSKP